MGKRKPTIDRQLNIETARKQKVQKRAGDGPLVRYARDYEPTPTSIFEEAMTAVQMPLQSATFVDWGAGKGRVLCLAANYPFRAVIGVELFAELAEIARANLKALPTAWVRAHSLECVTGDAGAYRPPAGPKVVYMFNPFGPSVLKRALGKLAPEHSDRGGPPLYLIYHEAVHSHCVDQEPFLELRIKAPHWSVWASPESP